MPLSEHEQRLLEQMERALYADDPKLASTLRGKRGSGYDRQRLFLGVVGLIAGIGLLLAGVAIPMWVLGVLGFVAMLGGAWLALTGWRARPSATSAQSGTVTAAPSGTAAASAASARPRKSRGFMARMEQRWERRRDDGQAL